MPMQRRCLVPGCTCPGYVLNMESYQGSEEDLIESEKDELKPYCSLCRHAEEEHELAPSE